ncbi:hypothetical protein SAMN03097699_2493 [Flavobacteriaceae bacterium MAR_2010_188]|nr:hypothetical protein SAMN03097699_2493 [Flavobacteriaceae bacterium MAR_2010_188]
MKVFLLITTSLVLFLNCKNNSTPTAKYDAIPLNKNEMSDAQSLIDTVIYEATTRGYFEKIIIVENKASYTNQRNEAEAQYHNFDNNLWVSLVEEIDSVGASKISNFEAPSKDHQFDGAAMANLEIHSKDSIYRTQTFDKGNPPKELNSIYKTIQTIKESILKQ